MSSLGALAKRFEKRIKNSKSSSEIKSQNELFYNALINSIYHEKNSITPHHLGI